MTTTNTMGNTSRTTQNELEQTNANIAFFNELCKGEGAKELIANHHPNECVSIECII